jgi:hypothetical protein
MGDPQIIKHKTGEEVEIRTTDTGKRQTTNGER